MRAHHFVLYAMSKVLGGADLHKYEHVPKIGEHLNMLKLTTKSRRQEDVELLIAEPAIVQEAAVVQIPEAMSIYQWVCKQTATGK